MAEISADDAQYLTRCVDLARAALDAGDEPFGSVLVAVDGRTLAEDRNRTRTMADETRHPEFELARWAAAHVPRPERAGATVYTSGEHCPMCAAAHAWVGLGRIVYAVSSAQLSAWRAEWGITSSGPVPPLPIQQVAPHVPVSGPAPQFEEAMCALHRRAQSWRR